MPFLALVALGCNDYDLFRPKNSNGTLDDESGLPSAHHLAPPEESTDTAPPAEEPWDEGNFADAPIYAHTSGDLYEVLDPTTGATDWLGPMNSADESDIEFVDIAIDLDGRIFGGTMDNRLFRVNALNGVVEYVCTPGVQMVGMTFGSNGKLYAGGTQSITEIDPATCSVAYLADHTSEHTSGDLVGLPDGYLYWTVTDGSHDALMRVDPQSGHITSVGSINASATFGLGYDENVLYAFSESGQVLAIDPSNGATTQLASGGPAWWGATTNPVVW